MLGKEFGGSGTAKIDITLSEGWVEYRQALELVVLSDWPRALALLAEAETTFRTVDDQHGLWRALIGQALLHWREGGASLAIARALAALRVAEMADDGFAVGCVAWQIANMSLAQGDYRKAADYFDQAQLALDAVGMAPPGGVLAGAARLCNEIARWQQMCERQQIGRREAELAAAEIQRDLTACLNQAARSIRAAPAAFAGLNEGPGFFLPEPPTLLAMPEAVLPRPGLSGWLTRLWRRLVQSGDPSVVEGLVHVSVPAAPEIADPESGASSQDGQAESPAALAAAPAEVVPQAPPEPPLAPATPGRHSPAAPQPPAAPLSAPEQPRPAARAGLAISCFGNFRVYYNDQPIDRWESARGRLIFKYLVARRPSSAPKELLADRFWPESEPELARRSLHQAIYCLRQTFKRVAPEEQIVQFVDDRYQINPEIAVWVDSEEFGQMVERARALSAAGKLEQAMSSYAVAVDLYSAPFLAEDRYEEWTEEPRRTFQAMYLEALHCLARQHYERGEHPSAILLCQRALAEESCDEESHQMLMACYLAQGLRHLAVRQYQICANTLKVELGLAPSEELESFYRRSVAAG
ncbi:MAG: hypothetical protein IPO81_14030 [Kouleothrix sp.]|nr:hypothetical protein [Kouleothrix sp.]